MHQIEQNSETHSIFSIIEQYHTALTLLDAYDHQTLSKPEGSNATYRLTYPECKALITQMQFYKESCLFGNEKDDSLHSTKHSMEKSFILL